MKVWDTVAFGGLYLIPSRNGLTRPSAVRGAGYKMVNMGELFQHPRLKNPEMERVNLREDEKSAFSLQMGDLLFARQSLVLEGAGKCSIVIECEESTVFESHLIRVRLDTGRGEPLFYFYYFGSELGLGTVQTIVRQVAAAGIRGSDLARLKVICPPLPVQRKIAAILSAYDDLIENNTRRIALLEKMAEEVYREWFVRLRFPGYESVPVHHGVPEGWNITRLDGIVELAYGKALKDENRTQGEYPVVGSSGIVGTHNMYFVPGPGIVIGRKGNVGSVHWIDANFYPIDTVFFVKSELNLHYLYFLMQSLNFLNNDAAVPGLNRAQAYANKFLLPPGLLLRNFEHIASTLFSQNRNLQVSNENLRIVRDRLLSRLLSGKLDVESLDVRFPPGMSEAAEVR